MEVLHASAECYPLAKVGGLGDVVGALPKFQNKLGFTAKVIVPAYRTKFFHENEWEEIHSGTIWLHFIPIQFKILKEKSDKLGFQLYVVDIAGLLDTTSPYGYNNDTERFIGFEQAVLTWIKESATKPNIIHCHDYHTGLIPFMMYYTSLYKDLKNIPTIFTIHNGLYQGWIDWNKSNLLPAFDPENGGMIEWGSQINQMAAGIKCSWRFTTVSKSYLEELLLNANGLEQLIRSESQKAYGILNGIDTQVWNPETDTMIDSQYNFKNVSQKKEGNKKGLCEAFALDPEKPLISFIGRLVGEKGADLLAESFRQSLLRHSGEVTFLVLGSGVDSIEAELNALKTSWKGHFNCYIGYHEHLSHMIYAGSDFLLMPSLIEPCGLNQMYALRYGTIPIVRSIGGLKDTVIDFGVKGGFGIRFDQLSVRDICHSVDRAIMLFQEKEKMDELRKQIMKIDHSWDSSAKHYLDLYRSLK